MGTRGVRGHGHVTGGLDAAFVRSYYPRMRRNWNRTCCRLCVAIVWLAAHGGAALAEPPPEPDAAGEIKDHRGEASEHAAQARAHAAEAMKHSREDVRAKFKDLRDTARVKREVVRAELKQARANAREHFSEARQQLHAAGSSAHEQLKAARDSLRKGLLAGKAELKVTGEQLNREFAELRARAEETRASVWAQWRAKLRSPEAIDARMQRELEKHARREAKLRRIEAVARDSSDTGALDRVARLRARETERHETRMQRLTADRAASGKAQP